MGKFQHYFLDWKELFRPGSFKEFELMVDFPPEQVYARPHSWEKTLFLMELCRLSYLRDAHLRKGIFTELSLEEERFCSRQGSQFMLLKNKAADTPESILLFRGTDDFFDYKNIFTFGKTSWPSGGKIYKGFHKSFESIRKDIQEISRELEGQSTWIIGHSLGGILAILSSCYFEQAELNVFGVPKLGNKAFFDSLNKKITCFHTRRDFIKTMPILLRNLSYPASGTIQTPEVDNRSCPSFLYVHSPISYSHNIKLGQHDLIYGDDK